MLGFQIGFMLFRGDVVAREGDSANPGAWPATSRSSPLLVAPLSVPYIALLPRHPHSLSPPQGSEDTNMVSCRRQKVFFVFDLEMCFKEWSN